ncbi:hypothetical protein B0T14DRAFT_31066 [Immersiella caudata]|uniref:Uncharacterized protein n=1 Tax=Immersiella caudata TaxID=314043 RepID=A0AA39XE99_9PEZI|nr:hypothetical protein B0T14DRAFT_31066 [Immersiella caudata]
MARKPRASPARISIAPSRIKTAFLDFGHDRGGVAAGEENSCGPTPRPGKAGGGCVENRCTRNEHRELYPSAAAIIQRREPSLAPRMFCLQYCHPVEEFHASNFRQVSLTDSGEAFRGEGDGDAEARQLALHPVLGAFHPISRLNSGSSSFALAGDTVRSSIGQHPAPARRPAGFSGPVRDPQAALGDPLRIPPFYPGAI